MSTWPEMEKCPRAVAWQQIQKGRHRGCQRSEHRKRRSLSPTLHAHPSRYKPHFVNNLEKIRDCETRTHHTMDDARVLLILKQEAVHALANGEQLRRRRCSHRCQPAIGNLHRELVCSVNSTRKILHRVIRSMTSFQQRTHIIQVILANGSHF